MANIKASPEMSGYLMKRPGEESLAWTFYDIQDFPAATALPQQNFFFARALTGTTVTLEDTNVRTASQPVSEGQRFYCSSFGIAVLPAFNNVSPVRDATAAGTPTLADDLAAVSNRGFVQLQLLGQKTYIEGSPISLYPAGFGVYGSASEALVAAQAQGSVITNGIPNIGNVHKLSLAIPSKTSVNAIISFPKAAVTPTNAIRIGCFMTGVLFRSNQ